MEPKSLASLALDATIKATPLYYCAVTPIGPGDEHTLRRLKALPMHKLHADWKKCLSDMLWAVYRDLDNALPDKEKWTRSPVFAETYRESIAAEADWDIACEESTSEFLASCVDPPQIVAGYGQQYHRYYLGTPVWHIRVVKVEME